MDMYRKRRRSRRLAAKVANGEKVSRHWGAHGAYRCPKFMTTDLPSVRTPEHGVYTRAAEKKEVQLINAVSRKAAKSAERSYRSSRSARGTTTRSIWELAKNSCVYRPVMPTGP